MSEEQLRANDLAQQKGSSAWLIALPLPDKGYILTRRELYAAIYLSYRWQLKRLSTYCSCGKPFTVDNTLSCLKGGFIHGRHNEIRDLLAAVLKEVSYDVSCEPALAPLTGEVFPSSANSADDIAARGFWKRCERAFFDIRVFNPYASTHRRQTLSSSFTVTEREKKRPYNGLWKLSNGPFTPVVFCETHPLLSSLADKLATRKNFARSIVLSWLRRKIAFTLLSAQVLCVRGSRAWQKSTHITSTSDIPLSEWNSTLN